MILKPSPVSSNRFTYCAAERMLVAEMSDLESGFGRVYDDACDEGLTVVSARTGREVTFTVNHIERDGEGDLLYWDLVPANFGRSTALGCDVTVRIFND